MGYELIDVRPMTKRIGAEIFGVDLREPLGNQAYAEIHDALMKHQVVFFRDQEIDHEAHKALGRAFGDLHMHSAVKGLDDHPEVVAIHADEHSKFVAGEKWHSDLSCDPEPPMGSILYAKGPERSAGWWLTPGWEGPSQSLFPASRSP